MQYLLLYFRLLLCTFGIMTICGLLTALSRFLFLKLMGNPAGYRVHQISSIIGTPVHELGHALFCPLFAHRITDIKLWTPNSTDRTFGHVSHSYNRKNPWAILGNMFIGLGPIFSGLIVMTLLLWLCFPATLHEWINSITNLTLTEADTADCIQMIGKMLRSMINEFGHSSISVWIQIIGLIFMMSISLHITVSPADVKNAASSIPLWLGILGVFTISIFLLDICGVYILKPVSVGLQSFGITQAALFSIVFVFAAIQLIPAVLVGLVRLVTRLIK